MVIAARGPLSEALLAALTAPPGTPIAAPRVDAAHALDGEDLHYALYLCYELHYRGLPGVDDRWEWDPALLAFRAALEDAFEAALVAAIGPAAGGVDASEMDLALRAIAEADDSPSLSRHLERDGTIAQFHEFLVHRSAYQLKEADPHSWALPRLHGRPKAAMVEVQADEYGAGRPDRIHAQLFADAMEAVGLDSAYGAYLDRIPGITLATVNLMSLCGLHRRLRGAIVGHLALFEMTSSVPNRRYANGLRRLGCVDGALDFFDEHVEADAVHEAIAAVDLAGGLAEQDPALSPQILWGARALVFVEGRWAGHVLDRWERGETSLLGGSALETRLAPLLEA
ncbi:MAG: iron-containing redox enzyme family protein [Solirubrobacteraceae bacterium]